MSGGTRSPSIPTADFALGDAQGAVDRRLASWEAANVGRRLWQKDPSFWPEAPASDVAGRLGWLHLPEELRAKASELSLFAAGVRHDGFREVLVLGMGGSSLAPEVFGETFRSGGAAADLRVVDTTHPDALRRIAQRLDLERTLFVVSSKSGTTMEPNSFFDYFWHLIGHAPGNPGSRFVAITDPGTPLESLARAHEFRAVFSGPPEVGGRYSALSVFGLVPAQLAGAPVDRILGSAEAMARACGPSVPVLENPAVRLAAALGELALAGRDKVTFIADPPFASFPKWAEQLLAESTGKQGRGLVPVVDEPPAAPASYGRDRVFVLLESAEGPSPVGKLRAGLLGAGHPVVRIRLNDPVDLGGEFFRWEAAIALVGPILRIDPFDQPDVELAKQLAREAMAQHGRPANLPAGTSVPVEDAAALSAAIARWSSNLEPAAYLAVQAYLAPSVPTSEALESLRGAILERLGRATTLGYGPRFLHSTGQLHKGGPPTGRFLQLTDHPATDVPVPGTDYTFGRLIQAQALGDLRALLQRGRVVLRVELGTDTAGGLRALERVVHG